MSQTSWEGKQDAAAERQDVLASVAAAPPPTVCRCGDPHCRLVTEMVRTAEGRTFVAVVHSQCGRDYWGPAGHEGALWLARFKRERYGGPVPTTMQPSDASDTTGQVLLGVGAPFVVKGQTVIPCVAPPESAGLVVRPISMAEFNRLAQPRAVADGHRQAMLTIPTGEARMMLHDGLECKSLKRGHRCQVQNVAKNLNKSAHQTGRRYRIAHTKDGMVAVAVIACPRGT